METDNNWCSSPGTIKIRIKQNDLGIIAVDMCTVRVEPVKMMQHIDALYPKIIAEVTPKCLSRSFVM